MIRQRYLITGGLGFIGSHFVKHLIELGIETEQIVVLDKMTYASDPKRLSNTGVSILEGDIRNADLLTTLLEKYEITSIINFAAETHVDNSIISQDAFVKTNIIGVQTLLETSHRHWSKKSKIQKLDYRFIQISTDEVYGSSDMLSGEKFNESSPLRPKNPYAATKASADMIIGAFVNTYDYPAIIIRSTNNYGEGQHKEKLIPKVIEAIKENKNIPLYGDGEQKRTWLHVSDNCSAIYKIMDQGSVGEIYNVVGPTSESNKALVLQLIDIYEKNNESLYKGKIDYVKDRPGHDIFYNIDDTKIKKSLGFVPITPLNQGLKNLIKASI